MKKSKTILAGVTAATVILSSGIMAFAATDSNDATRLRGNRDKMTVMCDLTEDQRDAVQQARIDSMKEAIAELVVSSVITKEVSDQLLEEKAVPTTRSRIGTLTEESMPTINKSGQGRTDSLLTEEQRTTLYDTMMAIFKDKLSDLVDDGTITQDQADQFLNNKVKMQMGPGGKRGFSERAECKKTLNQETVSSETL